MKKITSIFLLSILAMTTWSQQINGGEYFFDTDPGVGNGSPFTINPSSDIVDFNFNISTTGMSVGTHYVWVRLKDTQEKWSIYANQKFYVYDTIIPQVLDIPQSNIVSGEYFVDTDPGVGNGTSFNLVSSDTVLKNFNINVTPYGIGTHYLFIRLKDADGKWSHYMHQTFDIQQYPLGGWVTDSTAISCFGGCDASATVTPTGGTPNWSFAWYNDSYTSMGITDSTATGLCAGLYHCVVTDDLGDKDTVDVIVTQPDLFAATPIATDAMCGSDNGTATVNIIGGTMPYTYLWGNGETTSMIDTLVGNTVYPLTVTDFNNCVANANVFVTATPAISISASAVSPSCYNVCDGGGMPTIIGGTAPFDYYWGNNTITENLSNVCEGNYTLSVTDDAGCIDTTSVTVINPPQIALTVISNNATCGVNDGNASVSITGGQTPYTYNWSSGSTVSLADTLGAGTYTVTVTDFGGCTNFETVLISDANGPVVSINDAINPNCTGGDDGSIDMTVGGGVPPMTYSWSNGATTEDVIGLSSGPYELTVIDDNGCTAIESVVLTDPNPMGVSFSITQANCGNSDGVSISSVSGGTSPYTYLWSTGGTNSAEASIPVGIHSVTVTDYNSCEITESFAMSEVNGPDVVIDNIVTTTCGFATGSINISATGGSGSYTYLWSNSETTQNISNVGAGLYEITVTDQANCSGVAVANIPAVQPNPQEICLVTVDTLTNTNKVVWTKPLIQGGLESYNIYRESSAAGVYQLVGNILYTSLSEYTDPIANPTVQAYRYKVSSVDTCGNEAFLSNHHKTIHLTLSSFSGDNYLNWDHYEGFTFPSYVIWWFSDQSGWNPLVTLASNVTSYTHSSPIGTNINYFIEAVPFTSCESTVKAVSYGSTRSNKHGISGGVAPPLADFTETSTAINIGQSIIFTETSISSPTTDSWLWTFTGGTPNISNAQNPTVIYNNVGVYDVKLIAYNSVGSDTITKFGWITVTDPGGATTAPVANFTASSTVIVAGGIIDFVDQSTNTPTSWAWTFTNGSPFTSSDQNPTGIVYNSEGTFDVSLTATNSAGADTELKSGYIIVGTSGIDGLEELNSLFIFPNPAVDKLNISIGLKGNQNIVLELIDIQGKVVVSKKISGENNVSTTFQVSNLASGSYLLRITTKSGSITKPIIKN